MDRQVLLKDPSGLVGVFDLNPAYKAVRANQTPAGVIPRFKKKEDINSMPKSILKHKIQTLTGKSVKTIEEEMKYKPKDPNEPSMDIDTMRRLASCLVLLSNNELPNYAEVEVEAITEPAVNIGSKRTSSSQVEAEVSKPRAGRRSIAASQANTSYASSAAASSGSKGKRRSIAVIPTPDKHEPELRKGRRSLAVQSLTDTSVQSPLARNGRRSALDINTPSRIGVVNAINQSTVSTSSISATKCLGPTSTTSENLALLEEEEETEELLASNPTPIMKEMMKGKSLGPKTIKCPSKVIEVKPSPIRPASPAPRADFVGASNSRVYLLAGDPMDLKFTKIISTLPLSAQFPGAHLTVVHTPAEWSPHEVFQVSKQIKQLNKDAGLDSFVVLVGTGLHNVHMNMEALMKHTQHVQFVTFHREDANVNIESGKLRETTSFFIAAYFFPGCDKTDSTLPSKMVRDGYTTCFRTDSTAHLERSIIDCFSESGEWLLDLCCGKRQLSLAAAEKGRCAIALHNDGDMLEQLGNYLRTLALTSDHTYRDKDGVVLNIVNRDTLMDCD